MTVPGDLELLTRSDSPLPDIFEPPISAIQQPSYEMGLRAANLLLKRLGSESPGEPQTVVMPAKLRRRRYSSASWRMERRSEHEPRN